jgi:hypothetical protein
MATTYISDELYDKILDALDNEEISTLVELFTTHGIQPTDKLNDAPREGYDDKQLETYIDYIIAYNLTKVLEYLIDENGLEVSDGLLARAMELNFDTYDYFISCGYIPEIECLRMAVHNAFSGIAEAILAINNELVLQLDDSNIEYLFSFDMDEETIETIRVLFNYHVPHKLFSRFLKALKDPEDKYFPVADEETDIAIEIIEFLEAQGVESFVNPEDLV